MKKTNNESNEEIKPSQIWSDAKINALKEYILSEIKNQSEEERAKTELLFTKYKNTLL